MEGAHRRNARRGHRVEPFIIGVAGGAASGKTMVCQLITQRLQEQGAVIVAQDWFYRDLTEAQLASLAECDFDCPDAVDEPLLLRCLDALKAREPCQVPVYDAAEHRRAQSTRRLLPADVVVLEGLHVLHSEAVRARLHMKIFVDADDDVRLARRVKRDVSELGRDVATVIRQYTRFVKPAFESYVAPSRRHADVVIPWHSGSGNAVAIDLIAEHIRLKLQQHDLRRLYANLQIIPSSFQIRGMHTIIRDANTSTADFAFYADRLLRLVVEAGLGCLPFEDKFVFTPTGRVYAGVEFAKR
ncbi:phosphoribulokinase/uridine kinase, partial [Helicosporidium sp. ATCC 50920]